MRGRGLARRCGEWTSSRPDVRIDPVRKSVSAAIGAPAAPRRRRVARRERRSTNRL